MFNHRLDFEPFRTNPTMTRSGVTTVTPNSVQIGMD